MSQHPNPPQARGETDVAGVLLRLAETIAGHTRLDNLLPVIVELATTVTDYDACLLSLWDDKRACFLPAAAHGVPSWLERIFYRLPIAPGDIPLVDEVVRRRRSVTTSIPDPLLPPSLWRRLSHQVILVVPLLYHDQVIGGMVMLHEQNQEGYGPHQTTLINGIARQTALAVASAHAFEAERRRRRDLETLQETIAVLSAELELNALYQHIAQRAAITFSAPAAALVLWHPTRAGNAAIYRTLDGSNGHAAETLPLTAAYGLSAAYAQQQRIPADTIHDLLQTHSDALPFALPDLRLSPLGDPDLIKTEGLRAALVILLRRGERFLGLVEVYQQAEPLNFDDDALALAQALGHQIVIALENARLYQQAQDRSRQLAQVLAAGHQVRANQDIAVILQRIVEGIQQGLGWQAVLITRYDRAAGQVHGLASAGNLSPVLDRLQRPTSLEGWHPLYEREQYRISRSYFVPAERGGNLIARASAACETPDDDIPTVGRDARTAATRRTSARPARDWQPNDFLIVPIQDRRGEILGVIAVDAPRHGRRPTLSDVQALEVFADQAAMALENARLFQSEQTRRRQLEGLQKTIAALSAELLPDPLLQLIAAQTAAMFDTSAAAVLLWDEAQAELVVRAHHGLPHDFAQRLRLPYKHLLSELECSSDPDVFTIYDLKAPAPLRGQHPAAEGKITQILGAAPGLCSALLCTLQLGGQLSGVLLVYDDHPRRFHTDEKALARTLAQQATIAIENAQLYTALQTERERLRALSARLTQAQEAERARIARELHDEAGQALTAVRLQLDYVTSTLPPDVPSPVRHQIEEAQALIVRTLEEIRRISIDLRPSLLDDLGLTPALRWQCDHISRRAKLAVRFESKGDVRRLDADVETAVYRAAQEALTNIARHAQATEAKISLEYQGHGLRLTITDDGRGFSDAADQETGLGLMGMQERLSAVGGTLHIDSRPGAGSTLSIEVPL